MQMPNNNYFNIPGVTTPSLQSAAQSNMAREPQSPIERVQLYTSFVNDLSDIQARDVSQDGKTNLFITRDYRHIFAKAWGADGKITTVEYEMKVNGQNSQQQTQGEITLEGLMAAITNLQNNLDGRITQLEQRQTSRNAGYYSGKKNNNNNNNRTEKSPPKKGGLSDGQ